jgi:hypothetical protein
VESFLTRGRRERAACQIGPISRLTLIALRSKAITPEVLSGLQNYVL